MLYQIIYLLFVRFFTLKNETSKSIKRLEDLEAILGDEDRASDYTKKEILHKKFLTCVHTYYQRLLLSFLFLSKERKRKEKVIKKKRKRKY
jgi:hypothetical protein